jgi:ribonucleoside-diphosphate reductase alpha chain
MSRGWNGLPDISKVLYKETYFLPNETYDEWVLRICSAYANNDAHRDRMVGYITNYWFHPSTPISSNGGTNRGLPISCYVGEVEDSKEGIFNAWTESSWLGSGGGGIGVSWSNVREIGAPIGQHGGTSSGVIPFMKVDSALTQAVSQGNVRRMSLADYLDISHPEIEEFLEIRKPTGDQNRRALELHHGVTIPDAFMNAVIEDLEWNLISPKSNKVVKTVKARDLWAKLLEMRVTTGEPYIVFTDTVNRMSPPEYHALDYQITTSNLCSEICLHTSPTKTNVCCLASLNLEYWDEYKDIIDQVVADCTDFLDNVLQDFIDRTKDRVGFENARAAAIEERALGLGVMGLHSLLQSNNTPFESPMSKGLNQQIFKAIRESSDRHQEQLVGIEFGKEDVQCPLSVQTNTARRNIVTLAVAPTMSISNLCNLASSGVEPWISNAFSKKLKQGTFPIRNKHLDQVIRNYAANLPNDTSYDYMNTIEQQWESIKKHNGSVQHLDWMDDWTKDVFKTAFEIKQDVIIDLAGDRSEFIDQGQSINLFIPGNSHVQYISDLHILAWKKGLKSLYYLRSTNPSKASTDSKDRKHININTMSIDEMSVDTCPSCT